jgi:hypothetical protein
VASPGTDDRRNGPARRRKVLLAPVTITPAKPLGPSHLKGLFWTDVMYRATALLADVTYHSSHTAYDTCAQTVGFWEYLDRTLGDTDYSSCSSEDIGELYIRFRRHGERPRFAAWQPYIEAVERHGWVHPASARVLQLWARHYAKLGLHDPGLAEYQPPGMTVAEMVDRLSRLRMCLDMRGHGGPVYLDATRYGLPLRTIVAADGRPNHVACALRDLLPLAPGYDTVVLLCDRELDRDYLLLQRVLTRLGTAVHRIAIGRVPINGQISSARHGGWRGYTAAAILEAVGPQFAEPVLHLGMRLYFIATLGPGDSESFRGDLLVRCLRRAERLLAAGASAAGQGETPAERAAGPGRTSLIAFLERHLGTHSCVDPYRLTSRLFAARLGDPGGELLTAVFT